MDKKQNKDLHKACSKGDVPGIKKAIAAGADVNLADKKGNAALHMAVESGALDACKALLEAGADPRHKNAKGLTPAEYADKKKKKNLVQVLREYEAGGGLRTVCKATVAVYTYEAEQWKQFDASMVSLELVKCVHPFSYRLVGKTAAKSIVDAVLDVNFQYSKSTDMFHNFQDGPRIWGFNFAAEDEAKMILAQLEIAREEIKNPPPPPEAPKPAAAAPSVPAGAAVGGPPAKTGGGPPPPPPPPSAPTPPAAPAAPSGGGPPAPPSGGPPAPSGPAGGNKPMSMADAIAAKAAGGGLKSAAEPRPAGGGGGGGDLLSELSNRVKKRPVATGEGGSPAAAAAGGVPNAGQLLAFKEGLLNDFREELAAMRAGLIEDLVAEINSLP